MIDLITDSNSSSGGKSDRVGAAHTGIQFQIKSLDLLKTQFYTTAPNESDRMLAYSANH